MGALRDAVMAKATPNQRAQMAADDWAKNNHGWVMICNITSDDVNKIQLQWNDVLETEREHWVGQFGWEGDARIAWEMFGRQGRYKVPTGFIMDDGEFKTVEQWRQMDLRGRGFVQVFDLR